MINSAQFKLAFPAAIKYRGKNCFSGVGSPLCVFLASGIKVPRVCRMTCLRNCYIKSIKFLILFVAVPSFIGIPCFQVIVAAARKTRRAVREEKQFSAYDTLLAVRRASDSESGRNTLRPFPGSKGRAKFTECFLFRQDGWKSYYKILFPIRIFISSFWHFP